MRRNDKEITNRRIIDGILQSAPVCRIALALDSAPYIVPVNFAVKRDVLYFHCALTGRKIDILRQNTAVCFEVDLPGNLVHGETACGWGMTYQSVIGFGRAFFIENREDKVAALNVLMKKYAGRDAFTYAQDKLDKVCVIGVKIEALSGKQSG
ncbi:MAG: pyridoxamine 5'-phosphate oxidase family protein [Smithellaceae bacterium]